MFQKETQSISKSTEINSILELKYVLKFTKYDCSECVLNRKMNYKSLKVSKHLK